jgi:hypothetical protein
MERFAVGQSFDGGHMLPVVGCGKRETAVDAPVIDQNGAGAALSVIAPFLGAGEPRMFTEQVEKGDARIEIELEFPSVYMEREGNGIA